MRVWLVTIGEPLPTDGQGGERLLRAGLLAERLAKGGHEVVWWSSTFDHVRKRQRFPTDTTFPLESGVLLKLLHGCGYARNVSFKRLIDHAMLARKFTRQAEDMPHPDVILCSLPPLELSASVTRYGKAHAVPVVVDVRDLWPDIFLELVPPWMRPFLNIALAPLWRDARKACHEAFAITGNAPSFVQWGLKRASRPATVLDRSFPHAYMARTPDSTKIQEAQAYWERHGLHQDNPAFVACFIGTIGRQSDIETVIAAARLLEKQGNPFKFVLCGTGDHLEAMRQQAVDLPSVIFPGWINAAQIWTLLRIAAVGLDVHRGHVGYVTNLSNKPIEYFSAGLPIVSSLKGYLESFLAEHECGLTYPDGDAEALAQILSDLDNDRSKLTTMSRNAQRVFSERFDADKVYGEMIAYLQEAVRAYAARRD